MTNIETGKHYYLGASSNPKRVLVTEVNADMVRVSMGGTETVYPRAIAESLIASGTRNAPAFWGPAER